LRARCTTRPTQASVPSTARSTAPTANIAPKSTRPASAAITSWLLVETTPRMTAGSANTGSASSVAKTSSDDAVSPDAAAPPGVPACTSIRYCSAPAAAPPPGTIRPNALPASCDVATA